jgi:hypothetical protein
MGIQFRNRGEPIGMRKAIIWSLCVAALAGTAARLELRNRVPWNSVVEINLTREMEGERVVSGASVIPANSMSDAISESDSEKAIDAARDDKRVSGLVLRIGGEGAFASMSKMAGRYNLEGLAAHISAFRKSGKPAVCIAGYEGDDGANILARACDKMIGESVSRDEDVDDYFDARFGEDNWSGIEVREYLKRAGHLD